MINYVLVWRITITYISYENIQQFKNNSNTIFEIA